MVGKEPTGVRSVLREIDAAKDRRKREEMGKNAKDAIDLIVREAYSLHVRLERLKLFMIDSLGYCEEEVDRIILGDGRGFPYGGTAPTKRDT